MIKAITTAPSTTVPIDGASSEISNYSTKREKQRKSKWFTRSTQREPSVWMILAILQVLFFFFGIPVISRNYVWNQLFGPIIASHPTHGNEIAKFVFFLVTPLPFFVVYNLMMLPIYAGNFPFFERYRIQQHVCWPWFDPRPEVREAIWKLIHRSLKLGALNLGVVIPAFNAFKIYVEREIFKKDSTFFLQTDDGHWPSTGKIIRDLFLMVVIQDFAAYVAHKAMHIYPTLYKFHKAHHEYKINITLATQHFHPIEAIIIGMIPVHLPSFFVRDAHSITWFMYLLWTMLASLEDHVGYAFPWSPFRWFPGSVLTEEHEFHHSMNAGCYGFKFTWFNSLFGGYEVYNRYCAKRDREAFKTKVLG